MKNQKPAKAAGCKIFQASQQTLARLSVLVAVQLVNVIFHSPARIKRGLPLSLSFEITTVAFIA